jgi:phosphomannomutase
LLSILSDGQQTLAEFRKSLPLMINTPELRFGCPEDRKFAVVDEITERLERAGADMNSVDGVRVNMADGWWLLRASNTESALVARCEASCEVGLAKTKAALAAQFQESGVALPDGL